MLLLLIDFDESWHNKSQLERYIVLLPWSITSELEFEIDGPKG